jgi:hypothetical protein
MSSNESSSSSDSEVEAIIKHFIKHLNGLGFINQTSFDAYFLQSSRASKTSTNVFSDLVPPLSREEYPSSITPVRRGTRRACDERGSRRGREQAAHVCPLRQQHRLV